jgi:peroxiredoxin
MSQTRPNPAKQHLLIGPVVGLVVGALAGWMWTSSAGPSPRLSQTLDIAGPRLGGGEFDLKEMRGKVVLVDFWATWCPPCVAEVPNVRKAYNRYHADGFEVVGVSLDDSKEALAKFVQKHELPWPQVFFGDKDKVGFSNPLARRYGVEAIPSTFLVDRAGTVAQTDLRGAELERAVAGLLGKGLPSEGVVAAVARFSANHIFQLWWTAVGCLVGCLMGGLTERVLRQTVSGRASY